MHKFSGVHRYEPDDWSKVGEFFPTKEKLEKLEQLVIKGNFIVAEHWHYRGARCPDRMVIEDTDDFVEYLESKAIAGDIISIYDLTDESWNQKTVLMEGKCPDENGEIPKKGAY